MVPKYNLFAYSNNNNSTIKLEDLSINHEVVKFPRVPKYFHETNAFFFYATADDYVVVKFLINIQMRTVYAIHNVQWYSCYAWRWVMTVFWRHSFGLAYPKKYSLRPCVTERQTSNTHKVFFFSLIITKLSEILVGVHRITNQTVYRNLYKYERFSRKWFISLKKKKPRIRVKHYRL